MILLALWGVTNSYPQLTVAVAVGLGGHKAQMTTQLARNDACRVPKGRRRRWRRSGGGRRRCESGQSGENAFPSSIARGRGRSASPRAIPRSGGSQSQSTSSPNLGCRGGERGRRRRRLGSLGQRDERTTAAELESSCARRARLGPLGLRPRGRGREKATPDERRPRGRGSQEVLLLLKAELLHLAADGRRQQQGRRRGGTTRWRAGGGYNIYTDDRSLTKPQGHPPGEGERHEMFHDCLQKPRERRRSLSLSRGGGSAFAYRDHHHPRLPTLDFAG